MGLLRTCFLILTLLGFYASAQTKNSYKCDFEGGTICNFLTNDRYNTENWKVGRGKVNSLDTGPSVDHTLGNANGSYLYVNVSAAKTNEVNIQSIKLMTGYCVRFFYHMYGADIGTLTVIAQNERTSESTRYFSRSRTQGDRWKEALFSVNPSYSMRQRGYRIVFSAKRQTSSSVKGDIALDDVELTIGKCPDSKKEAATVCTFDDYDCGYTASRTSAFTWEWKTAGSEVNYAGEIPQQDHTLGTYMGGYWFSGYQNGWLGARKSDRAILSSPVYDKPKTSMNCLHFYYYVDGDGSNFFWGSVKEAFVQVFLNFPQSKTSRVWLTTKAKNTTFHRQWTYAETKAEITEKFQLQFSASIDSPVYALIAVDDIKLVPGACPEAGFCDFEEDKCNWADGTGEYNWVRKSGSSHTNSEIGPSTDNTMGTENGNYVVFSTKGKEAGAKANLESEYFPPGQDELCLSFYYYMSGKDLGTLKVIRNEENVTQATLWFLKGDQGSLWQKGMAVMKPSVFHNNVVFQGIIGEGTNGFMALDDVKVRKGEKCQLAPTGADPRYEAMERLACTFDDLNLCSWEQDNSTIPWKFGNVTLIGSTGPKEPVNGQGHYIFVSSYDGSQSNAGKISRIKSAVINSFYPESACFTFYYHMFGAHVGELRVFLVPMQDENTPLGRQVIWRRRGTQPDKWMQFRDSLNVTEGDYRLEIEAEGGDGFAGDIAIDEVMMSIGVCPEIDLCDFESNLCGWKVEPDQKELFYWHRGSELPKGPAIDHTSASSYGSYLQAYAEDGAEVEAVTSLVSKTYSRSWGPHCLTFWYYRPGLSVGKISVFTRRPFDNDLQWSVTKDVGKFWHYAQVTIDVKDTLQIVIQAEKGTNNDYAMAIDDILIKNSKCGPPAACKFNNDYCSYFLNETADFSWLLGTGRVVNTQLIENPPLDNSVEDGMYVYADLTSGNLKENQTAVLVSEIIEAQTKGVSCATFYYYIGGEDKCVLSVGKQSLNNTQKDMFYQKLELFNRPENTGGWTMGTAEIPSTQGETLQLYFTAIRGSGPRAFIAVDDITVNDGKCLEPTTEPPVTVTELPISSVTCDFDGGDLCSWKADSGKLKWAVNIPTRSKDKMPKFDHTKGNYLGQYAYILGDSVSAKEATLTSASANILWRGNFCFSFWYYMDVEGDNSLKVSASHGTSWWNTEYVPFWSRTGNTGYRWRHVYVHIKSSKPSPNLRFIGTVKTGVIAIDDLGAKDGSCPASRMCTFDDDDDMCSFTQDSQNAVDWEVRKGDDNDTVYAITDHTTQSIEGSYLYIAFNGTSKETFQRSRIFSPKRPASPMGYCVTFYYHIYNVSKLSLNTYMSTSRGLSDPQWSVSISQGLLWHGARFSVVSKSTSWQIVFEAVAGNRGYGQLAIDDVSVENGPCPDPGYCDFDSENCLWENVRPPIQELKKTLKPAKKKGPLPQLAVKQRANVQTDLLKDDFDWVRHIGDDYFGPPRDHTYKSTQGFYLLLDPRNSEQGQKAVYMSERLRFPSGVCLKLWYSMPNYNNGSSLLVYHTSDFKDANMLQLFQGSTNEDWKEGRVSVIPTPTSDTPVMDFWIFLSGVTGSNILGYVAIDDISISEGPCQDVSEHFDCGGGQLVLPADVCNFRKDCKNGLDEQNCADCDFESGNCGYTAANLQDFRWIRSRAGTENIRYDHTKEDASGYFMVASATTYYYIANINTHLRSSVLRNAFSTCSLEFWYNVMTNMKLSVAMVRNNQTTEIWTPPRWSSDVWTKGEVFIGRIPRTFQVSFLAERVRGHNTHAAIDDVQMLGCETSTMGKPGTCSSDQFDCKNSRCISKENICDYTDDCGNFEDERQETCENSIARCSFDQSFCDWVSDNSSGAVFQRRAPFSSLDQGPTRDHTSASGSGQFLYVPGRIRPVPARILGPLLQPTEGCQIRFFYDIRGAGPISLQIKTRTESNGEEMVAWTREDPTEGYFFVEDRVTFQRSSSFQVIIEASIEIGVGNVNYIALDDISFNHKCVPQTFPLPTLPPVLTTPIPIKKCNKKEFTCTSKNQCIPIKQKCDFRPDCTDGSDEDHCGQCDFHFDMCGLVSLSASTRYKWQRAQADAFSFSKNTSVPVTDSQGDPLGYFAVLTGKVASGYYESSTAMRTPPLGPTSHACKLQFFYHFNVRAGLLKVYVSQIGYGTRTERFAVKNNSGKNWQFASVPIGNYPAGKVIEFHGNANSAFAFGQTQDIAIDNIKYVNCDPELIYTEPLNCTFDIDECGWHPDNNFTRGTWKRAKKSPQDYGPQSDHTGKNGYFMYVQAASVLSKGDTAHLVSLKQNATDQRCFNFWYHMYGQDVGTLNIITRTDKGNTTIWSKTNSQGNAWKQGSRTIRSADPYQIVIEAIIGSFARPVIAVDDIEIYEDVCPHPVACEFEADFCEWTQKGWVLQLGDGNVPSKDHTTDTKTGRYAALAEEYGTLTSPDFNFTLNDYCLNFWYFMEGTRNTTLKVQRVLQVSPDKAYTAWADMAEPKIKGQWLHSRASITDMSQGDYNIVIVGTRDNGSEAIAVDDVAIENGACPPYGSCTFERDFCTWRNLKKPVSSGLQWIRNSGSTITVGTGPSVDHTTNSSDGWYIYMDGRYGSIGQTAVLESEILHYAPKACIKYWYHMYGWGSGSLQVKFVNHTDSKVYHVMTISGSQGANWYPVKRLVTDLPPTYKIRFVGVKGYNGDLALDDIVIQPDSCADPEITTLPPTEFPLTDWDCNFENGDFCSWVSGGNWVVQDGRKAVINKEGPIIDHTREDSLGRYAYYKPVSNSSQFLVSNIINFSQYDYCFRFWYYLYSPAPATLEINAIQYGQLSDTLWLKSSSSSPQWKYGTYYFEKSVDTNIVLSPTRTKEGVGDIAIDDIHLKMGSCPVIKGQPCDFEANDICGFKLSSGDYVSWKRVQAKTIKKDTLGPIVDKTYGTKEGHYLMVTPSPNARVFGDNKAHLIMPEVPSTGVYRSCVQFWYQMAGTNVVSLNMYMRTPGGDLPQFPPWSHSSKHGNIWKVGQKTIDANYVHEIVFEAVTSRGDNGFIALDEIVVKEGSCPPPGSCTFELDLCTWQNAERTGVDAEWIRNSGPTPTEGTGPNVDHTLGTEFGSYIYLKADDSSKRNQIGILQSEYFSVSTERCLSFWAHMNGSDMGTLMVNMSYYSEAQAKNVNRHLWKTEGNQGEKWFNRLITIDINGLQVEDEYQIVIMGITKGALSDIALDDIEVTSGKCYEIPKDAFDCRDGKSVSRDKVCDFEKDCSNGEDEANCGECDFEHGDCGWRDTTTSWNHEKWTRVQGKDQYSRVKGPGYDHTSNTSEGYFLMVDTSSKWGWQQSFLRSPDIKLKKSYASCVMNFYYVHGANSMAGLKVKKRLEASAVGTVWERYGILETGWQLGSVYLGTTERPFYIELEHYSSNQRSYIAIDDITFKNCSLPEKRDKCGSKQFKCGNGRCVSRYALCDHTDDCGDRSDEETKMCSKYPKACTFEIGGDCEWTVKGQSRNFWSVQNSVNHRSNTNFGPLLDHTKGMDNVGRYLILKRNHADYKNPVSYYYSPNYKLSGSTYCSLRFYYYMLGAEDSRLKVYIEKEEDGWTWDEKFREYGSLGQMWNRGMVNLRTKDPFHFIIEGNPGNTTGSSIAIDDISLSEGCQPYDGDLPTPIPTPLPTKSPCNDDQFSCHNGKPMCIPKDRKCDFTLDCSDGSDEKNCGPCSFTEDFCGWETESPGQYEWRRRNASAVDVDESGPSVDSKNSTVGWFAYVTTGWGYYDEPASMISPPLPPTSSHCVMSFWLYATPKVSGKFYVHYKAPDNWYRTFDKLWSKKSSFPDGWQQVEVKIPESYYEGTVVRFSSQPNWRWNDDDHVVALDDISFMNCNPNRLLADCDFDDSSFNDGLCFWRQSQSNWLKWKRGKGSTETNFTGPTSDHTTGHGYYMYIDPEENGAYTQASLLSPTLPRNDPEGSCFSFWYHMYGQHVGVLGIETSFYWSFQREWTLSRSQGNKWHLGEVFLKSSRDFTINVIAYSDWGTENNIAVDDFKMVDGPCIRTSVCDFEYDFCGWNATSDGLAEWERTQGSGNWSVEKPRVDHTTNTALGYFINLPFKRPGDLVRLESPMYKNYGDMCVKFWYHMFGNDIGTLAVYQRTTQEGRLDNLKSLWKKSGDHAGGWKLGRVTMKSLPSYYVAFEAQTGQGPLGHIALDDIQISHGACSDPVSCTFEIDACGWSNADAFADVDWIRRTGLDNQFGKGPSSDHGTPSSQGHYMYALLTGLKADSQSMLISEDLEIYPNYCLSLWYNMYNTVNSSLYVQQVLIGLGWEGVLEVKSSDADSDIWSRLETNITVENAGSFFQLGLTAIVHSDQDNDTYRGIALDDVSLIRAPCGQEVITTPFPPTTTTEYPPTKYDCSFEDQCHWANDPDAEAKWLILTGHSERKLTRPRTDHTTLATYGHYLTLDSNSKSYYYKTARFVSEDGIDPRAYPEGICFKFWYHMYGNSPGSLYLKSQNFYDKEKTETIWTRFRSQGPNWKYEQVHIVKNYAYRLMFEGDGTFYGDMSLDDFTLNYGLCPPRQVCDAEQDYCGFSHDPESDFQWHRGNGASTNGPSIDHTYGTSLGNYFYVNPKDSKALDGKVASLESGPYQPEKMCMQFWYYLNGEDVGSLEVLIRNGDSKVSKWKENGDNSEFWHGSEVTLSEKLPSSYSYIFQVTAGSGFVNGSIAIDDIAVKTECPSLGSCNFEDDMCLWMNDPGADLQWLRGTGEMTDTAPGVDVTLGNQFGTYLYVHVVRSWAANPKPARIISPFFTYAKKRCINYWNFRNGSYFDGALTVSTYDLVKDEIVEREHFTNEKLGRWNNEQVEIDEEEDDGKYQIIFEAQLTNTEMNFLALDDITVYDGACEPIEDRKPDFTCDEGKTHISDDLRCDFYKDCEDGKDESECGTYCDFETSEPIPCNWQTSTNAASWNQTLAAGNADPSIDHTKKTPGMGYYMKMNLLSKYTYTAEAHLTSPALIQASGTCRMFFWYYFYAVYNDENFAVYYDSGHSSTRTELFKLEGDQEKTWMQAEVVIGRIRNRFTVGIVGKTKSSTGIIAIDDITFENCNLPRPQGQPQKCGENEYQCQNGNCISNDLVCDFVDDCGDNSDENRLLAKCEQYPGRCDFENRDYCGWRTPQESEYSFNIVTPKDSSVYSRIYINRDHTKNSNSGRLLYFNNYYKAKGVVARLASKVMETVDETCKLRFFYSYGMNFNSTRYDEITDIGVFNVFVRRDEVNVWKTVFTAREPPGQYFEKIILPLNFSDPFEIILETRIGSSSKFGGWAIDDVSFTSGCKVSNQTLPLSFLKPTPEPDVKCEADQFLCVADKRCLDADQVCNFAPDCSDSSDEAKCGDCTFDDDSNPTCGWSDARNRKWKRTKGKTGKNGLTSDVSGNGYYMYVQKDNGATSSTATLRSIDFQQASSMCEITFYYFMSGITNNDASLKLQLQTHDRSDVRLWREVSDQGNSWLNTTVSIGRREAGWHLDFIATHVHSEGDIAIDEIKFLRCAPPEKRKCANKDEFACLSGECINSTLVCDFSLDCTDGSDEMNCSSYLERCDFEDGFCSWTQDKGADQKWILTSGKELVEGEGPDRDHTRQDEMGRFLMATRRNEYYFQYNARITSPAFMADLSGKCKLRFWYHLHSFSTSSLSLYYQLADDSRLKFNNSWDGSDGDEWQRAEVALANKFNFHVVLIGSPASGNKGEVAIDDTSFTPECIPVYTIITTPIPTVQPRGICEKKGLFTCDDNSCVPMEVVCDFKTDCPYGRDEKSCPAFCDFELGSTCGWTGVTAIGDGVEFNVTVAEDGKRVSPYAPKVDKTTNTGQGSYLIVHSDLETEVGPLDQYNSPNFSACATTCKFTLWYAGRTRWMSPTVALVKPNGTYIELVQLFETDTWTREEIGLGRQKDTFSISIREKGEMHRNDFLAMDDIEFVNCALPKKETLCGTRFRCAVTQACIDRSRVCDLTDDCGDGSDEAECDGYTLIDFEHGLGVFSPWVYDQAPLTWDIRNGSVYGHITAKVGPAFDHTFSNEAGKYLAMTKGGKGGYNQKAVLISQVMTATKMKECQMRFYYYMFGKNVNTLSILFLRNHQGDFESMWNQTGEVGNFWMRGSVTLEESGTFQILIQGKAGVTTTDLIALDDISFTPACKFGSGSTLPPKETTTPGPTTTTPATGCRPDQFFCVKDQVCIAGIKKCDFRFDCSDKSDEAGCVRDYCDFQDSDLCGWMITHKFKNITRAKRDIHDTAFQWIAIQANDEHTKINLDHRPKRDHTKNSTEGWYLLADGAPGSAGDITSLVSPQISATHSHCAIDFWLHCPMFNCELNIYTSKLDSPIKQVWDAYTDLYGRKVSNTWMHAKAHLNALTNYQVRIDTIRPYTYSSAVCLDDIRFENCEPPRFVDHLNDTCNVGEFMCDNDKCIADNLLCDFNNDCGDNSDETDFRCQSFEARCNFDGVPCKHFRFENEPDAKWKIVSAYGSLYSVLPMTDHTTNSDEGKFASVSPGWNAESAKPKIASETIDGHSKKCKVRFWYHAINANNKIRVYKRSSYDEGGYKFIEEFSNEVLSYWHRAELEIINLDNKDFQIVLEASLLKTWSSINVDDLSLTQDCHLAPDRDLPGKPTTPPVIDDCLPDGYSCKTTGKCYTHAQRCNFQDDCGDNSDEENCGTSCDFEKGLCGWFNALGYEGQWAIKSGRAYYYLNLDSDHTKGTADGHYLMPTALAEEGDVAQLHSQTYIASGSNCNMSFWYYLDDTGGANIAVILVHNTKNKYEEVLKIDTDGGPKWVKAVAPIRAQQYFSIVIQGTQGRRHLYSMAIDDIDFTKCHTSHPPKECTSQERMCDDQKKCYKDWEYCDGKYDCDDKSDEYKCPVLHGDCDFDSDKWMDDCEWQSKQYEFEWSRAKEGRSNETGPARNQNLREGGYFLFIDSSKHSIGERAGVETPVFKPGKAKCHLRFWYFMKGSATLGRLEVRSEGEKGQNFPVFVKRGPQDDKWLQGHAEVGNSQNFRVSFVATVGGDDKTDIAIDEVKFTSGCNGGDDTLPTGPTPFCYKGDFQCKSKDQCIPKIFRCDCRYDCRDGSDEEGCDIVCLSTLTRPPMTTTTERPIPTLPQKHCPQGKILCNDQETCIPALYMCDGVKDCPDGSDEVDNCQYRCAENFFFCKDRASPPCMSREVLCNGINDCSDGSDELLCDKCPEDFCKNQANCSIVKRAPQCQCQPGYAQNRCFNLIDKPELEKLPNPQTAGVGWIIGVVIGTLLLIAIMFIIWYKRNTNAERARLAHAVDNPVYGLNLDTLTFGELNSHMPVRSEDGAGATAIENPLYAFKSEIK